MCCFVSLYDNHNPIVFCDHCDGGVHQRCYGVEDLDEPFYCDLCLLRKKRQDETSKQKEMVCVICRKSGCMMKLDTTYKKNENTYFHPFCLFSSNRAYYKNVMKIKGIIIDTKDIS